MVLFFYRIQFSEIFISEIVVDRIQFLTETTFSTKASPVCPSLVYIYLFVSVSNHA